MAICIRRRELLAALGGAAAWPLIARAQQPAVPVIGFLGSTSADGARTNLAAFQEGLKLAGYVENQNLKIEYRWAENRYERLPELASDLVAKGVSVIAVPPPIAAALAAKAATRTTPIVFLTAADPVVAGLIDSLNRPNGNITGVALFDGTLGPKNLELIHELIPTADIVGVFFNPDSPSGNVFLADAKRSAQILHQQLVPIPVRREADIDAAFEKLSQSQAKVLLVWPDAFLFSHRERLVARAAIDKIAVVSDLREFPVAGALSSYGGNSQEISRQFGVYVGKILKGAKPADMPVWQPTKFELVINLKTAKALGLEIPPQLLARADEVIE